MLAPLATALALSFTSPTAAPAPRPIVLAENTEGEAKPAHGEAAPAAGAHGHGAAEPSKPRGEASGQNPTGAPNPATPWSGVGGNGVSGTNPR